MCLRVNTRRCGTEEYAARLAAEGIAARRIGAAALLLERPLPVDRLPGFAAGEVSVQDAGAQRAAGLLDLRAGQRVLDACAAPGGKSAHILESAGVDLTALDIDPARCADVTRNLERLGLSAGVRAADCSAPETWWDGNAFDRILADVPCSASGVARRHPDIKWLRRPADVAAFAARQARILDALWRTLAAGGKLLYVSCSVFPEENGAVIDAFAARTPGVRRAPLADDGPAQWLPGPEHDGFFFSLLEKPA
jgi:16S rRNA (cytosine967-C5)-methyltransferase